MSSRALPWRAGIVACVLALLAGACADEEPPLRIGVVVDCVGIFRSFGDAELSGAQLPLIERGASRRGRRAQDGITPVTVAGRSVELVTGCAEAAEFSVITAELRRMAELEKVDAVVAGSAGADEIVIRDVARGHPQTVFLPAVHGPREATLRRPAANVFRFSGDHGQGVAGLATYAYRELGWRRAAIVLPNWDAGWGSRDAFAAEFCALGGTIEQQLGLDFFDPAGRDVDRVRRDVDGVAVFGGSYFDASGFLKRLAKRTDDPARQIVAGPALMDEPTTLRATSRALAGVTGSSYAYPPRMRAYLRDYSRAFPGVPASLASSELVTGYRDAVEAILLALEHADGSSARLPAELRRLRINLLGGPVRLDDNGQAVISTSLVRIGEPGAPGRQPILEPVSRRHGVDQSVGGLLAPSLAPGSRPAACKRGHTAWGDD
ncbi:MAG: ABC transporter substrate-binding protein [Actinomycetota bacterium]|nr:ABC transporter substrate-binding protein [Actinomycetota bacterium]